MYQLISMGGQALGSLFWGLLAGATSSVTSLLVSAALLLAVSEEWRLGRMKSTDVTVTSTEAKNRLDALLAAVEQRGFGHHHQSRSAGCNARTRASGGRVGSGNFPTHTLLCLVSTPSALVSSTLEALSHPATKLWATAASAWEICIKTRRPTRR